MRYAIALYHVVNPFSLGSYEELLHHEPLPADVPPEVWQPCLHDWAVARLRQGDYRFGMYLAAVMPTDDSGQPDDAQRDELLEQDIEPIEEQVYWSGACELVDA